MQSKVGLQLCIPIRRHDFVVRDVSIVVVVELVKKAMGIVATYASVLDDVAHVLSDLDVLLSFAESSLCAPIPYTRPQVQPTGSKMLHLPDCRHPCLEVQEGVSFIANDVNMRKGA